MTADLALATEGGSGTRLGGDVYVLSDHSRLWKWPPTSADQPD